MGVQHPAGAGNADDPNSCQLGHALQVAVLPNGHEPLANGVLKGGLLCVEHPRKIAKFASI